MSKNCLHLLRTLTWCLTVWILSGCASVPDGYKDPRDPLESYNRAMQKFNSHFDATIWKPVARGYKAITPEPIDRGITNFFANMRDVSSALNNTLQLKLSRTVTDVGRVLVNSTVGLLGFVDVASKINLPSYKEDFGQTLGYWGIGPGPYFVLPIVGPSDIRDAISLVPDWYSQPIAYTHDSKTAWGSSILYSIDTRADFLDASDAFEKAALDLYTFNRDAYLQKRRNDVYDGNPPADADTDLDMSTDDTSTDNPSTSKSTAPAAK